jgi:hypothetical protein
VDRHVVDALLRLVLDHVEEVLGGHVFDVAAELLEHLIDRNGADRDRGGVDDRGADRVDILAGGEVHDGVGAVVDRQMELFKLFLEVAGDGRVADVGVDFALGGDADGHRLEPLGEVDLIGGDHHAAGGHFVANQLGGEVLALGHKLHFGRNFARTGGFKLSCHGLAIS